mmetsp:Transcript_58016/g.133273  ORF Transcript_58016/g.133273 Transcript_58016/m.133273 type:complete len:265 (+) Transcript_58016:318-1112(+)
MLVGGVSARTTSSSRRRLHSSTPTAADEAGARALRPSRPPCTRTRRGHNHRAGSRLQRRRGSKASKNTNTNRSSINTSSSSGSSSSGSSSFARGRRSRQSRAVISSMPMRRGLQPPRALRGVHRRGVQRWQACRTLAVSRLRQAVCVSALRSVGCNGFLWRRAEEHFVLRVGPQARSRRGPSFLHTTVTVHHGVPSLVAEPSGRAVLRSRCEVTEALCTDLSSARLSQPMRPTVADSSALGETASPPYPIRQHASRRGKCQSHS